MTDAWEFIRRARSLLFVPGHRPDRFAKAADSGADGIIIDLEDAVGFDLKSSARENVRQWFSSGQNAIIRINSVDTPWYEDDITMLADDKRAVMLPKITSAEQVISVLARLPPGSCVVALLETSSGVLAAREICAVPGVVRAVFGNGDLVGSLGIEYEDRAALDYIRSAIALASDAAGISPPFDGGSMSLADEDLLISDAKHAISFGYTGKVCIHPSQVSIVNSIFTPSREKIQWARDVVAVEGDGSIAVLNDKVIGRPIIKRAKRLLAQWGSIVK
ncbi:HpcH/HpaI aldolase/citrate lyase family protein [Amycolatopsis pithecellobii]|uniref:CoA ester lyase n=1 Tax=Amycolatopsis pithecellobii TaxID=664692 RepID=A0A6N7YTK8_9PSEU|nr:CoA ester lyase [Amycolatopsis pithecellobii]MTD55278.1 CoA ester lyase [Amycolatopsis pithecellobii]